MSRIILITSALLLTLGCASQPRKPIPESQLAYPYGTYQHHVKVHVLAPERRNELRGVVQSSAERLQVVGLTPFGTTAFRIVENMKTGEIKKEFFVDVIRQNEERFMFFYAMIKELLYAPKGKLEFRVRDANYKLSKPDQDGIYRLVEIKNPQVELNIEVTGYEF